MRVLSCSSLAPTFSGLLQKDLFKEKLSLAKSYFKQNYCHAFHTKVCHLLLLRSRKFSNVPGTLFASFLRKISGSNGTSDKVVLFFRTERSKLKFVFQFFKAIFDTSSTPSRPFFNRYETDLDKW